jgi:hypothetical protein
VTRERFLKEEGERKGEKKNLLKVFQLGIVRREASKCPQQSNHWLHGK